MVQLDEVEYDKLCKDADDNNAIRGIVKIIAASIITIILIFAVIVPIVNLWLETQRVNLTIQSQKIQAVTNLEVKELESKGMTNEEYFRWLEVRK